MSLESGESERASAARWAIIGASGAIGRNLGPELERRGIAFRAIGRRRDALERRFGALSHAEIAPVDLRDDVGFRPALRDVTVGVYAVGLPYTDFAQHPVLMRKAVEGCIAAGVRRLIVVSNVYVYGVPQTTPVLETHPLTPSSFKGRMRLRQEEIALGAHQLGRLEVLVVRPADFYGPRTENSYAHTIVLAALANRPAHLLAPADTPHQLSYAPDIARILADLGLRDDVWGEAYNIGGPTTTMRAFAREVYSQAGAKFRALAINKWMVRAIGFFDPFMREMVEMHYLQEKPLIASDAKLRSKLGSIPETPLKAGIAAQIAAVRQERVEVVV